MEFDIDSNQDDNGNVDMDADDQGLKKTISTPPSKKWTMTNNKRTEQTNISPGEYKD